MECNYYNIKHEIVSEEVELDRTCTFSYTVIVIVSCNEALPSKSNNV